MASDMRRATCSPGVTTHARRENAKHRTCESMSRASASFSKSRPVSLSCTLLVIMTALELRTSLKAPSPSSPIAISFPISRSSLKQKLKNCRQRELLVCKSSKCNKTCDEWAAAWISLRPAIPAAHLRPHLRQRRRSTSPLLLTGASP
jgi:hypothetical protein